MKMKTVKKLCCILLAALFLAVGCRLPGATVRAADFRRGDVIAFGHYPQTLVTDEALLAALEALDPDPVWVPMGFTGDAAAEYTFYRDVDYAGETYRALYFTQANSNAQARYGYTANTVYWFRFEPIEWTVLDPDTGMLIANRILDTQPFANTIYNAQYADEENRYYLNNYAHSSIRAWLNGAFTGAAFSAEEAAVLVPREQDNSVSEMEAAISRYACENTNDPVFLLSYAEALNADWFPTDADRVRGGTPYARALGVENYYDQFPESDPANDFWFLRSPAASPVKQGYIGVTGSVSREMDDYSFDVGVCPAAYIDLDAYELLAAPEEPEPSPYADLTFSFADGMLTVGGTGSVPAVEDPAQTPFAPYAGDCRVLVLEAGIEAAESYAFDGLENVEILILRGPTALYDEAFAMNPKLGLVIAMDTFDCAPGAFAPDTAVSFYEPRQTPHTGDLPYGAAAHPYDFSDDTLNVGGGAAMDVYGLLDLMTVLCGRFDPIRYACFDSYTSTDLPFYVYDRGAKDYVPAENNTLQGVRFSVQVPADDGWTAVSFNEFCARAGSGSLDTFRLVGDLETGEEVKENTFKLIGDEIAATIQKILTWIVGLLNALFRIFSK